LRKLQNALLKLQTSDQKLTVTQTLALNANPNPDPDLILILAKLRSVFYKLRAI